MAQKPTDGNAPARSHADAGARDLSLAEARDLVLRLNPGLEAASLRLEAADGAIRQAGRLPNPSLEIEAENLGGDLPTTGEAETTVVVEQTIELAGKRRLRVAEARADRTLAAMDGEAARRDLLHRLDRAFITLVAARDRLGIAADARVTATEVEEAVSYLVEAGKVSPIELPRAESEVALAEAELARAEAGMRSAAALLAGLWNGVDLPRATGELATVIELPGGWQRALDPAALPHVRRWDALAERDEAVAARERAQAAPDLDLAAGYRRSADTGEETFIVAVGLNLPLWDRGRDAATAARALASAARHEGEVMRGELAAQLRAAAMELELAEREVSLVANEVVPRAREVFDAVTAGYALGELPLLDVLEARRSLFSARLRLVEALEHQALARADILHFLPIGPTDPGAQS
jgi:cobalt-zinc-cadmium efflux system outer membrane protein